MHIPVYSVKLSLLSLVTTENTLKVSGLLGPSGKTPDRSCPLSFLPLLIVIILMAMISPGSDGCEIA